MLKHCLGFNDFCHGEKSMRKIILHYFSFHKMFVYMVLQHFLSFSHLALLWAEKNCEKMFHFFKQITMLKRNPRKDLSTIKGTGFEDKSEPICDDFWFSETDRDISYDDMYKLSEAPGFKSYCMIVPNKVLVNELQELFQKHNISKITSIGCGDGLLEFFLSEKIKVVAADFYDRRDMATCFRKRVTYKQVKNINEIIFIPCDHALFLSWPLLHEWREYLNVFKGNCIIIYADDTCDPYPPTDFENYSYFRNWKEYSSFVLNNDGRKTLSIFVFERDLMCT